MLQSGNNTEFSHAAAASAVVVVGLCEAGCACFLKKSVQKLSLHCIVLFVAKAA